MKVRYYTNNSKALDKYKIMKAIRKGNTMSEMNTTIIEQLQRLEMLMHRNMIPGFPGGGRIHNPHRGQGRVLAILKIKPEISQRDLTYLLGMSKQSIAELLTKLEKNGCITRYPSEDDKRVMIVKLTEEGEKAAAEIDDSEPESTKILDCLNEEELQNFSEYLERIIKCCEEQFPEEDFERRHRAMEEFMMQHGPERGFGRRPEGPGMDGYRRRTGRPGNYDSRERRGRDHRHSDKREQDWDK